MKQFIKVALVAMLIAFAIKPAPLNKQVHAQTPEPTVVQVEPQKIPEVPVEVPVPTPVTEAPKAPVAAPVTPVKVQTSCDQWIAAAGITDVPNAKELIRRESNCRPAAVNKSSGACGVAQELPCGKSGCSRSDGACQVRWMNTYVLQRYKSWANAVNFHNANNWY